MIILNNDLSFNIAKTRISLGIGPDDDQSFVIQLMES